MSKYFTKKEYQDISDFYKLGTVLSVTPFTNGLWTPKVLLKTPQGFFVVSKYRIPEKGKLISKSAKSLMWEIDFIDSVSKLKVPQYLKAGKQAVVFYKKHPVTVSKYIEGKPPKRLTLKMLYAVGVFLGEFHTVGKRWKKDLSERRKFYHFPPKVVKEMMKVAVKQTNPLLKSVVREIENGVNKTNLPSNLPRGPIHVDLKPENELFIGEKLQAVLDFGNLYIGPLLLDVGKTIMWNCIHKGNLNMKEMKALLLGYEKKRKLTTTEKKFLKQSVLFAIYSHIFVDLYHVPLGAIPESYTKYLVTEFLPAARKIEKNRYEF